MRCESCGQEVPAVEDDVIDLTNDDEINDINAPMLVEKQCDCTNEENHPEGDHRCEQTGRPEYSGLCTACLFGCAP